MDWQWPPTGARAIVATKHGKERVIEPTLVGLGVDWLPVPPGFDSDRFGTFTRDVPRAGSQLAAAQAKAAAVFELLSEVRIAIASEGAFGPDPTIPFIAAGQELVLLKDRETGLELIGYDRTWETNFAQQTVETFEAAEAFASACGFPDHGLIVMADDGSRPIEKDIETLAALREAVARQIGEAERCWLETDMRAHRNPRRIKAIERAAQALARAADACCPSCRRPGFVPRTAAGRPCRWCGSQTLEAWRAVHECAGCGYREDQIFEPERRAEPGNCAACNP